MQEVIIAGGGPMGSIVGILLARKGVNVLIIEKQKHPRWKPCGEGLSQEGVELLKKYHIYQPVQHLFSDITGITFNILEKTIATHESTVPIAYTLDRTQFDHALLTHAQDKGTEVHESETVKSITTQKTIQVKTHQHTYQAKVVIGADGTYSIIGKLAYRPWRKNELGLSEVARYQLFDIHKTVKANTMEYYFIEGGMGWIFPRMKKDYVILNIGIVANENSKIRRVFNQFIMMIESSKKIRLIGHELDGKIWRHPIPVNGPCRGTYTNATVLVGDAGGFVHPLTGGGLKYGSLSAIYAAETIINFLNNEIESLEAYEKKWHKNIAPLFDKALEMREKLYFMNPLQLLEKIKTHPKLKEQLIQSFI